MKNAILFLLFLTIVLACKDESKVLLVNNDCYANLIPKPVEVIQHENIFSFNKRSRIYIDQDNSELYRIADYLGEIIRPATGYEFKIKTTSLIKQKGSIYLVTEDADSSIGKEGYEIEITEKAIFIKSPFSEGLFRGVQTLRQLLPKEIEKDSLLNAAIQIKNGYIKDYPRFEWRGAMLDVARHFFSVNDVKRYIDILSMYKINRFHIHLSDDQGWRIEIKSWPKLTEIGSKSAVGNYPGGFYTQKQFIEIIKYAEDRYITVIPEIDMPGHMNAALASYAELNCDGIASSPYTGMRVGFSSLCIDKEITYQFLDNVIREISEISLGKYIHIGGDEAHSTNLKDYKVFIEKTRDILLKYNKIMVGWEEISQADIDASSLLQHWNSNHAKKGAEIGLRVIMSPSEKAYLDMKYDSLTNLGLDWAGTTSVQDAYEWDPSERLEGVTDKSIIGVEAPLWSETIHNLKEIEYMAFPRIIGHAEIGWSLQENRNWEEYEVRLNDQLKRLELIGVNYYKK